MCLIVGFNFFLFSTKNHISHLFCPYIGTDTCAISQFQFLEAVASKIPAKWRMVGLSLGISSSILDGIDKHRRGDCLECFSDVLTYWQQQSTLQSPANWTTLVTVLQSNSVGEKELSDTIHNTYVSHTAS